MPAEGIFHNLVFLSIKKEYPGQAYKVMNALWGQGLMSLAKLLIVVDHWADGRNPQGAGVMVPHPSSRTFTYGSKMGLDATKKLPEEGFTREWPDVITMDEATKTKVDG